MSAIDEAFHRTFVVRGAGARLLAMHESLQPQTYRLRRLHHYRARELTPQSIDEHNEIIAAIERGDARGAMLSGQKNWQNAAVRVGEVLTRLGEYGRGARRWRRLAPRSARSSPPPSSIAAAIDCSRTRTQNTPLDASS